MWHVQYCTGQDIRRIRMADDSTDPDGASGDKRQMRGQKTDEEIKGG